MDVYTMTSKHYFWSYYTVLKYFHALIKEEADISK